MAVSPAHTPMCTPARARFSFHCLRSLLEKSAGRKVVGGNSAFGNSQNLASQNGSVAPPKTLQLRLTNGLFCRTLTKLGTCLRHTQMHKKAYGHHGARSTGSRPFWVEHVFRHHFCPFPHLAYGQTPTHFMLQASNLARLLFRHGGLKVLQNFLKP